MIVNTEKNEVKSNSMFKGQYVMPQDFRGDKYTLKIVNSIMYTIIAKIQLYTFPEFGCTRVWPCVMSLRG